MKRSLLIICFLPSLYFAQSSGKVWTEIGVKGSVTKKMDWAVEMTTRFSATGIDTYFPQLSLKYKVTKWFRPSVDYRAIYNKDNYGNYSFSNRLNFNAEFKHSISRFTGSARIRYQNTFNRVITGSSYNSEFDQAFRFKPQVSYDINNSIFSPIVSIEFFYNPTYGQFGQRFNRYRGFIGFELDLNNAHEVAFGYMIDQQFNVNAPKTKHILSLAYTYNLSYNKD
jgi:hypothetical protein